ncbi:putative phage abortive infection protein [Lactococcus lactis]|uniref:putative phage abortive infection protein n=1 Tax=Lactococcus lactis TaxID=1358 RepID=UPI00145614AA|nr:putative phage abortive infection protein [Lactococcus lactis]MCT0439564.1 hypothetical protein [Lactococcus lactis subsp. lactis]MCT2920579.1 hypothetical protein [Lactococcus lactis]NLS46169.1 hypothetical protein [Lactococcus lactis]
MTTKKNKKRYYKDWRFWVGLVIAVAIFYCLPALGKGYRFFFSEKVNPNNFSISRLELLQLGISLIAPILTYRVFRNTLKMQDEAKSDREKDKKAEEKRRNIDDANREFYSLLDLFKKEQNKQDTKDSISFLFDKAINSKDNYSFIKDYKIPLGNGTGFHYYLPTRVKYFNESDIPKKYTWENLSNQEKSELIISFQFDEVYNKMSSYFKIFHRILKNLNERYDEDKLDEREFKNYIGILRTQLSSEELVVILVNSLYIKRGLGLAIELIGTNLFGDENDFKIDQHFIIPEPKIVPDDLSIFINDIDGKNIEKRKDYEKKLKSIDDITKFEEIRNFKSFA